MTEKYFRVQGTMPILGADNRCALTVRFHPWDPTSLDAELLVLGDDTERRQVASRLTHLPMNYLEVTPTESGQDSIELLGLAGFGWSGDSLSMNASAVEIGISKDSLVDDTKFHVTVKLQPSGILGFWGGNHYSYDGEVKKERPDKKAILFSSTLGQLEALESYEYNETEAHGNKVTEQIQRATIMGEITVKAGSSLQAVHEQLLEEIRQACSGLSLCYRQPVSYYEVEYREVTSGPARRGLMRRRWSSSRIRRRGDDLVVAAKLADGGLDRLLNSIRSTRDPDAVNRAIRFLAASFEDSLESAYFMAFSALETVVDACLDPKERDTVTNSQWNKLQPKLRDAVSAEALSLGISPECTDEMKKKVTELRRVSLTSKVDLAVRNHTPKTMDLWTKESFSDGMKRATQLRNDLFHAAGALVDVEMAQDLIRIRTFTERLLLALLGWPSEDIWHWYDQDLKRLNHR